MFPPVCSKSGCFMNFKICNYTSSYNWFYIGICHWDNMCSWFITSHHLLRINTRLFQLSLGLYFTLIKQQQQLLWVQNIQSKSSRKNASHVVCSPLYIPFLLIVLVRLHLPTVKQVTLDHFSEYKISSHLCFRKYVWRVNNNAIPKLWYSFWCVLH